MHQGKHTASLQREPGSLQDFRTLCSLKFLSRFSSFGVEMVMGALKRRSVLPFLFTQSVGFTAMLWLNLTENWPYKHEKNYPGLWGVGGLTEG